MDFSSSTRALHSLERRRPALPSEIIEISKQLLTEETSSEIYLKGISTLLNNASNRWEGLAVALLLATQILVEAVAADHDKKVYIDGPRVPDESKTDEVSDSSRRSFSEEELGEVIKNLHVY